MKKSISLLIIMTAIAGADTLLVPSEYPSIQNAINAAQNGDTVLVSPGEYEGPINFNKNIVVLSTHGAGSTHITASHNYHCVSMQGGQDSTAVLEGFFISNSLSDSTVSRDTVSAGGGLYIVYSSPTIRNNIISDCLATNYAAGVYAWHSSMTMSGCTIANNSFPIMSGGMEARECGLGDQPLRIIDCTFTGNHAQDNAGGFVAVDCGSVVFMNNIICNNVCDLGASGLFAANVTNMQLFGNYFWGNSWAAGLSICQSEAIVIGNLINSTSNGRGIYVYKSVVLLENNAVLNNSSTFNGGGLQIYDGSVVVRNTIIRGNTAPAGSQIHLEHSSQAYIEYSNIEYGQDSVFVDPTSILNWGPGNIDMDPLFETGPLGDYHLSTSSPCIDAGNPASEYNDPEDPFNPGYALWPAMGYIRNDMGAFGGSGINYWLFVEEEESSAIEEVLSLKSFPNPFSSSCTVCYQLDDASYVNLSVYDLSGRLVETLVDASVPAGMYSEYFDASGLCSGMYLIRLVAGDLSASRRCIVIR